MLIVIILALFAISASCQTVIGTNESSFKIKTKAILVQPKALYGSKADTLKEVTAVMTLECSDSTKTKVFITLVADVDEEENVSYYCLWVDQDGLEEWYPVVLNNGFQRFSLKEPSGPFEDWQTQGVIDIRQERVLLKIGQNNFHCKNFTIYTNSPDNFPRKVAYKLLKSRWGRS